MRTALGSAQAEYSGVPGNGRMQGGEIERISTWLVERGIAGASETELLHGFCAA